MTRTARTAVTALALLTIIGVTWRVHDIEELQRTLAPTTFGKAPAGYGALFDLLSELGLPVARSYDPPELLPSGGTLWWVEPTSVCHSATSMPPVSKRDLLENSEWPGAEWFNAGGTAVLFLPPAVQGNEPCGPVAALALPTRQVAHVAETSDGEPKTTAQVVEGTVAPKVRHLELPPLSSFTDAGGWAVAATVDARPFVLEQRSGRGRIVVVADATFLRNAWLDRGDAAPLALDLVRAFGTPLFDEREHGLRAEQNTLRYLARSPALGVFAGLAVFGILFAWRGGALPPRSGLQTDTPAPSTDAFVESLATLYARTGDYAQVFERYRELTAARLRRHFGLHPDTPVRTLVDWLRDYRQVSPHAVHVLADGVPVSSEAGLRAAVQSLDLLVLEATR
jgi:hypothetical protein